MWVVFAVSFTEEGRKMASQNVIIPDVKSGLNMMLIPAAQKPPAAPGWRRRKNILLNNLEINGAARINAWVDSMRASSPTHLKYTPSLAEDQSSWIVRY